ncbi:glycosyltransferase [Flaviaesturariibacter flavus]|uniref:Glycosyltransferase n=1 Tax=Flaviaesturariibacter flavus TaxID=2502780 RepID=A0A4R1BBV5_9BACT|nr:polysaccharide deacetylase family protein [Flaviaesturariibacter flavus]TCJ14501.1 glycosyltransferase [Flaviaesturariibacter flavus]
MQSRQVFQTQSATRWHRFQWSSRLIILLLLLAVVAVVFTLATARSPELPQLKDFKQALSDPQSRLAEKSPLARRYKSFRQFFTEKDLTAKQASYRSKSVAYPHPFGDGAAALRAGFYVNWDPNSFQSLQRNIHKMNLVIPEWFFFAQKADTTINAQGRRIITYSDSIVTQIDPKALAIMRAARVPVMPVMTNAWKETFRGAIVHRILTDPAKKERFIRQLIGLLKTNHFAGVNIDFEELEEPTNEPLVALQRELYSRLHAEGLLLSQDVSPFNSDYDYAALGACNDYLFVMAYDQNNKGTKAGPVAHQKWIEAALEDALKHLPPQKVVLCLAAYGYDWPREENNPADVDVVAYRSAISLAKEAQTIPVFDNDSYNLYFSYYDDADVIHDVYFTDAATTFNALRFATEAQLAGTALWRLGVEDQRIWKFYNNDLSREAARRLNFGSMAQVLSPENVSYSGYGEVLDVLATPEKGDIRFEIDSSELLISEEVYTNLPTSFMAKKYGWNGPDTIRNRKKIVLTFDDGPDPTWTPRILDVLSKKGVPATFFVVGRNCENNIPLLKRIFREGHEIGDHTFTHPNIAEVSRKRAVVEMESTRLLIECITGHSTVLFRAPYNADFTPEKIEELLPVAIARSHNYLDVGESIDPEDWEEGIRADTIFRRVVARKAAIEAEGRDLTGGNIILLHDAGGDSREQTLKALPMIIDYYKARGYQFTTVADYLGKTRDAVMPPVPKGSGYWLIQANYVVALSGYWLGSILFSMFVLFIIFSMARILLMATLALLEKRRETRAALVFPQLGHYPLVSVIVPAYNEEINAVASLQNLLKTNYPNYNIIFVDDGSRDSTYARVAEAFEGHPKVKVFTKANGGKASALNFGIAQTDAEYVVCIDADTKLRPDAVSELMKHFLSDEAHTIGAVAGNVKVGNEVNYLTRWQAIEYITSQNFDRRAFAYVDAVTVVPGAIGGFRKEAIAAAGGFTTDTLAEDCDLSIRILRAGYSIRNENGALAFTEAPEKLQQFLKQRYRWSFGVLQTFWKHRDLLFNGRYGWLGWLAIPNIILFQYIIPAFIPLADFFMVLGLATGNAGRILPYYAAFMLLDAAIAVVAFRMERERLGRLLWLLPQRLVYRWLMWIVLFRSVRRALKGELQQWGVLKRTGNVSDMTGPATA